MTSSCPGNWRAYVDTRFWHPDGRLGFKDQDAERVDQMVLMDPESATKIDGVRIGYEVKTVRIGYDTDRLRSKVLPEDDDIRGGGSFPKDRRRHGRSQEKFKFETA